MSVLGWSVVAQDEQAPTFDVRFFIYVWQPDRFIEYGVETIQLPELFYRSGEQFLSFTPRAGRRTSAMRYQGESPLRLYKKNPQPVEDASPFVPYAEINLPAGSEEIVGFIFPNQQITNAEGMRLLRASALNVNPETFRPGEPVFINLSEQTIAFRFGENVETLEPGQSVPLNAPPSGERLPVTLAVREEGQWQTMLTTSIALSSRARSLVLIEPLRAGSEWQLVRIRLD